MSKIKVTVLATRNMRRSALSFKQEDASPEGNEDDDLFSGLDVKSTEQVKNSAIAASSSRSIVDSQSLITNYVNNFEPSFASVTFDLGSDSSSANNKQNDEESSVFDFIRSSSSRKKIASLDEFEGLEFKSSHGVFAFQMSDSSNKSNDLTRSILERQGSWSQPMNRSKKVSLDELDLNSATPPNTSPTVFSPIRSISSGSTKLASVQSDIKVIEAEILQVCENQSRCFQRRNKIYENSVELWREIASLEKIQSEALKNEDYSKADTLTHEIQNKYASTKRNQQALSIIEQSLRELRQKHVNLFKSLVQAQKTLENFYEAEKDKTRKRLQQHVVDVEGLNKTETARINDLREQLEKEQSEVVFDADILSKNEAELNEKIEEHTRSEVAERDSLSKKRQEIRTEISDLLFRVEQLRFEEKNYTVKIEELDKKVASITEQFQPEKEEILREKSELDKREKELEKKMTSVNSTETQLQEKLERYKLEQETMETNLKTLELQMADLAVIMNKFEDESIEMTKLIDYFENRAKRDSEWDKEILIAQNAVDQLDEQVKLLTSRVIQDQQTYSSVQQDIATIDTQLPALEEQKKLAVAGRDFRVAGRLSSRIKDLKSTHEERVTFLVGKRESLEKDQEALRVAKKNLEEQNKKLAEVKRKTGAELYGELSESLLQLRSRYDMIKQKDYKELEALLQNEIKNLEYRIEHIQMSHGLSESSQVSEGGPNTQPKSPDTESETVVLVDNGVRLQQLEAELEDAVKKEDYDLADQIETTIKTIRNSISHQ
ncbi:7478_t:CDS:10 [Paraglomus occultum]|uniref:7478_t:CDS:1 n=1 Tax=Paraglomus occultum TaxID=144539 RepID=A0A9N8VSI4_9GLOM|nr:7478_t:CDS:10 [Paraglomus occultum]